MGSNLPKLCRFLVVPDLAVIDGQFRSPTDPVVVVIEGLIVERSEDQFLVLVTTLDTNPHVLTDTSGFVWKFDLYVVAVFVLGHRR